MAAFQQIIYVICVILTIKSTYLHMTKTKKKKKRRRGSEKRCIHYKEILTSLNAPRQCPLILLEKVGCRQGRALGSEEKQNVLSM
jgi:hypothetical protein